MDLNSAVNREGEMGPIPFRTGRFFHIGNSWYFTCREGMDRGPYDSRSLAELALAEHIKACKEVETQYFN